MNYKKVKSQLSWSSRIAAPWLIMQHSDNSVGVCLTLLFLAPNKLSWIHLSMSACLLYICHSWLTSSSLSWPTLQYSPRYFLILKRVPAMAVFSFVLRSLKSEKTNDLFLACITRLSWSYIFNHTFGFVLVANFKYPINYHLYPHYRTQLMEMINPLSVTVNKNSERNILHQTFMFVES